MGKVTGFLELDRQDQTYIAASERISNFKEFSVPLLTTDSIQVIVHNSQ